MIAAAMTLSGICQIKKHNAAVIKKLKGMAQLAGKRITTNKKITLITGVSADKIIRFIHLTLNRFESFLVFDD